MRSIFLFMLVMTISLSLSLIGCGPKKEASCSDAISVSKSMETNQEKVNYLIGQANAFYKSKEFQHAIDVAQYVLRYLDSDSQAVKDLLENAKVALREQVANAADETKRNWGF